MAVSAASFGEATSAFRRPEGLCRMVDEREGRKVSKRKKVLGAEGAEKPFLGTDADGIGTVPKGNLTSAD